MKIRNVTIAIDEEVARWARVWAAEHNTSLSRLVADMLRERMGRESAYETAMEDYLSVAPRDISGGQEYPSRDEVHDRRIR